MPKMSQNDEKRNINANYFFRLRKHHTQKNDWGLKQKKTQTTHIQSFAFFVELEGFEPSSKQGINLLSTCLASHFLSDSGRFVANLPKPYPLELHCYCGEQQQLLRLCDTRVQMPPFRASGE